jgi:hypothetical protein
MNCVPGTPHNQDRVEVMFVDYGNKEYIERDKVCPLLPQFLASPVFSYRCSLQGVASPDNFWSPEHCAKFEDMVLEKEFTVNFVDYDQSQDAYNVLLQCDDSTVNAQFAQMIGCKVRQCLMALFSVCFFFLFAYLII